MRLEVGAAFLHSASRAARAAPSRATEDVREDVAHPGAAEVEALKAAEPAGSTLARGRERAGTRVVLRALLGVAEDVVGLGDFLEARFGVLVTGVAVGMVLARELPGRPS